MATFPSPLRRPLLPALLVAVALVLGPAPAASAAGDDPPGRTIVKHRVVPGDTPSGLAVRYHAWTREVIALNGPVLRVGEVVRIPVVDAAVRKKKPAKPRPKLSKQDRRMHAAGWRYWKMPRTEVRALITREARSQGVPVRLALAVAWQESGWRQPLVSVDRAIGVMQLLPTSGEWMEMYLDRQINLRNTRHNIRAGVRMLKVLLDNTSSQRRAVAAYYQGLAGLREHGMYQETRRYVANVMAIRQRVHQLP